MVFLKNSRTLFNKRDLSDYLRERLNEVSNKVNSISEDQFLISSDNDIIDHVYSLMTVVPLEFYEGSKEMDKIETKIDVSEWRERNPFGDPGPIYVPGIKITVSIPFSGYIGLWELKPNSYQLKFPIGNITPPGSPRSNEIGYIEIVMTQPSDKNPVEFKNELDDNIETIKFFINSQKQEIESFNNGLKEEIRKLVLNRRDRLKAHDKIVQVLNIPLKRRGGLPEIKPIPVKRKLIRPLPSIPKGGIKQEVGIEDKDYNDILSIVRYGGRTFETTPKTYKDHDEEELRDIILAFLNCYYEGGATGETFRKNGKTDILIKIDDRAAFVAECKIWRGSEELLNSIDQLLDYLTWRDCKAAIIIFNKHNAKFSEILTKMPNTIITHPLFDKNLEYELENKDEGEWRYIFKSKEDEMKKIIIHLFVFNLYVKEQTAYKKTID